MKIYELRKNTIVINVYNREREEQVKTRERIVATVVSSSIVMIVDILLKKFVVI